MLNLPDSYLENSFVLMSVEPGKAYAYWDFLEHSPLAPKSFIDSSNLNLGPHGQDRGTVIKIYELGESDDLSNSHIVKEYLVDLKCCSLFFDLNWDQNRYQAVIGTLSRQGRFMAVTVSNILGSFRQPISQREFGLEDAYLESGQSYEEISTLKSGRKKLSPLTAECERKFKIGISSVISAAVKIS